MRKLFVAMLAFVVSSPAWASTGGSVTEDDILISNVQQHATASSGNRGMQMATFRDSSNLWGGSQGIAGPSPWLDVTAYGAKCDGATDDTMAIASAISTWNQNLSGNTTSAGVLYFPRGANPCKFNGSVFSVTHNKGWLYVLMENGFLLTGPVTPTSLTSFVGRGGNFQGLGGTANLGHNITWMPAGTAIEALNISGNGSGFYFEGINFENSGLTSTVSPVHFHAIGGGGPAFINIVNCQINSNSTNAAVLFDADSTTGPAGFGVFFRDTAIATVPTAASAINAINVGNFHFIGGAIYGSSVIFKNTGVASAGDVSFDHVLSEGLTNKDFLILDTSAGGGVVETDFTLKAVALADVVGTVYLVKGIGTGNRGINIEMSPEGNIGTGIIDPATTDPQGLKGVYCKGAGCDAVPAAVTSAQVAGLYTFPTNIRTITLFTGSAAGGTGFVPSPLTINGSQDFLGVSNAFVSGSNNVPVGAGRTYVDSSNNGFTCIQHSLVGCPLGTSSIPWLNLFLGGHFNQASSNSDIAGTFSCSGGRKSITFATAFTSTPVIVVSDETTAGGARVSAHSTSGFTVTCTGTIDVFDYVVIGNPN